MAKKTVIKKDVINKLVAFAAEHQNNKKKLNAGQIREMVSIVVIGIGVHLDESNLAELKEFCDVNPLAQKIMKAKIAKLKSV